MKRLADNYPQVVSCVFVPSRRIAPRTQRARLAMPRRIGCGMDPTIPPPAFRSRAGSYALNGWMYGGGFAQDNRPSDRNAIVKEGDTQSSSQTPVLAEGTWVDVWPQEKETPARNLLDGGTVLTMSVLTIARLGAGPKASYATVSPGAKLPGAINISFCVPASVSHDGTALQVRWNDHRHHRRRHLHDGQRGNGVCLREVIRPRSPQF
jgi:hypothetical protein